MGSANRQTAVGRKGQTRLGDTDTRDAVPSIANCCTGSLRSRGAFCVAEAMSGCQEWAVSEVQWWWTARSADQRQEEAVRAQSHPRAGNEVSLHREGG